MSDELRDGRGRLVLACRQCCEEEIADAEALIGQPYTYVICHGLAPLSGQSEESMLTEPKVTELTPEEYLVNRREWLAKIERAEADQRERDREACERAVGVYGSP